jgi:hypothetical protein
MPLATVHVNFRPLSGNWDGQHWDAQEARCSNNFMSGPTPPVPPAGASSIVWQVTGLSDPDAVVFNVVVDLPGDDEVLFRGVRNNTETPYPPAPSVTDVANGVQQHNGRRWDEYYRRGIYIASVSGATAPFTVDVSAASPSLGRARAKVIRALEV